MNKNALGAKQADIPVQTYLIKAVTDLFYSSSIFVSFISSADLQLCYLLLIF